MNGVRRWLVAAGSAAATVLIAGAQPALAAPAQQAPAAAYRPVWLADDSATTLDMVAKSIRADRLQAAGDTGAGVGVALIDTGVAPVAGLRDADVVDGPDLAVESQAPGRTHLDTYGHGTHLAGIIAGSGAGLRGLAPGVRLTSVKVGSFNGAVDVTQVMAAVDWVVAHRNDDPAHPIRVINLSYGTDSTQDYRIDPLAHAVENAWRAGIVVVAAGGNGGATAGTLTDPAQDPYLIAVGAADTGSSAGAGDDTVAGFSSRGNATRHVDLVAPGRSIVSLRDPGSTVDQAYPGARVGTELFKGSGTSQAAAVVSAATALLLQRYPDLSPDQVKAALVRGAHRLPLADPIAQGAGELDLARTAAVARQPSDPQAWPASSGTGSLEAARGAVHLAVDGVPLTGENDLFGPFDTTAWAAASSAGTAWAGGTWMGRELTAASWSEIPSPTGAPRLTWSSLTWSSLTWSSLTWSSLTWSSLTWSSLTWSSLTWSSLTWSSLTWSSLTWSSLTWSSLTWSDAGWLG